jgi:hypothetical protein
LAKPELEAPSEEDRESTDIKDVLKASFLTKMQNFYTAYEDAFTRRQLFDVTNANLKKKF